MSLTLSNRYIVAHLWTERDTIGGDRWRQSAMEPMPPYEHYEMAGIVYQINDEELKIALDKLLNERHNNVYQLKPSLGLGQ